MYKCKIKSNKELPQASIKALESFFEKLLNKDSERFLKIIKGV